MRWVYLAIVVFLVAAVLIFVVQNIEIVSISFLGSALSAPLALIVLVVYVLGAATGGSLYALLRRFGGLKNGPDPRQPAPLCHGTVRQEPCRPQGQVSIQGSRRAAR